MVLLPVTSCALQTKFSGPYVIDKKSGETEYADATSDRRNVNMLKPYVTCSESAAPYVAGFSLV